MSPCPTDSTPSTPPTPAHGQPSLGTTCEGYLVKHGSHATCPSLYPTPLCIVRLEPYPRTKSKQEGTRRIVKPLPKLPCLHLMA